MKFRQILGQPFERIGKKEVLSLRLGEEYVVLEEDATSLKGAVVKDQPADFGVCLYKDDRIVLTEKSPEDTGYDFKISVRKQSGAGQIFYFSKNQLLGKFLRVKESPKDQPK